MRVCDAPSGRRRRASGVSPLARVACGEKGVSLGRRALGISIRRFRRGNPGIYTHMYAFTAVFLLSPNCLALFLLRK